MPPSESASCGSCLQPPPHQKPAAQAQAQAEHEVAPRASHGLRERTQGTAAHGCGMMQHGRRWWDGGRWGAHHCTSSCSCDMSAAGM